MKIIAAHLLEPRQFIVLERGQRQVQMSLAAALDMPAPSQRPWTIALVGSGGKSTALQTLADEGIAEGRRVLLSTTTRMWLPADERSRVQTVYDAVSVWSAGRPAWAGQPAEPGKMAGVSPEILRNIASQADLVLVEADGSRGLPCKVPALHEPVIPSWSDQIVVVAGLSAVGQPIAAVAHRPELVCKMLNTERQHVLTTKDLAILIALGYLKPLQQAGYREIAVLLNQADHPEQLSAAADLASQIQTIIDESNPSGGRT